MFGPAGNLAISSLILWVARGVDRGGAGLVPSASRPLGWNNGPILILVNIGAVLSLEAFGFRFKKVSAQVTRIRHGENQKVHDMKEKTLETSFYHCIGMH